MSLPAKITIPAGQSSTRIEIKPYANTEVSSFSRNVIVSVANGPGYLVGEGSAAEVTIFYQSGALYFANLAPQTSASGAYGTVALKLASDNSSLTISARFANLSSPVTAAYLRLGDPGQSGTLLVRLPSSDSANTQWTISPTGPFSASDIITALQQGRIFATVDTASHPTGELSGTAALRCIGVVPSSRRPSSGPNRTDYGSRRGALSNPNHLRSDARVH